MMDAFFFVPKHRVQRPPRCEQHGGRTRIAAVHASASAAIGRCLGVAGVVGGCCVYNSGQN